MKNLNETAKAILEGAEKVIHDDNNVKMTELTNRLGKTIIRIDAGKQTVVLDKKSAIALAKVAHMKDFALGIRKIK